jgi:hypothetical protein
MIVKTVEIPFIDSDYSKGIAIVKYQKSLPVEIQVFINDKQYINSDCNDLYESLRRIRKQLEGEGIKLMCNGAAKNVRPSAMQRDMSVGELAYWLVEGERKPNIVNIFEGNMGIDYASGEEQENFYKEVWKKSIV